MAIGLERYARARVHGYCPIVPSFLHGLLAYGSQVYDRHGSNSSRMGVSIIPEMLRLLAKRPDSPICFLLTNSTIPCYRAAMIPTNATIIRKAYDDFANGDIPAVLQAFDTSIIWHVPRHSPLSGD